MLQIQTDLSTMCRWYRTDGRNGAELNNKLSMKRSDEINAACRIGEQQWNDPEAEKAFEVNYNAGEIIPRQGEDVNITAEEAQEKGINLDTDN